MVPRASPQTWSPKLASCPMGTRIVQLGISSQPQPGVEKGEREARTYPKTTELLQMILGDTPMHQNAPPQPEEGEEDRNTNTKSRPAGGHRAAACWTLGKLHKACETQGQEQRDTSEESHTGKQTRSCPSHPPAPSLRPASSDPSEMQLSTCKSSRWGAPIHSHHTQPQHPSWPSVHLAGLRPEASREMRGCRMPAPGPPKGSRGSPG